MQLVVTGSSSGIGRFLVERLIEKGHHVWGLARSDQSAHRSKSFSPVRCDVTKWEDVERAGREVQGPIGALICCAGIQGAVGFSMDLDAHAWSDTVRANIDGTFFPMKAFYSRLIAGPGHGKALFFSGGGSTGPRAMFSAYGAAKTAIVRLAENLAVEAREKNHLIDINAIAPGAIATAMTDEVLQMGPALAGQKEYDAAKKTKDQSAEATLGKVWGLIEVLLSSDSDGLSGKLISAPWDPWQSFAKTKGDLMKSDIFTLRRMVPPQ